MEGVRKGWVLTSEVTMATVQHQGNGRSLSTTFHQDFSTTSLLTSTPTLPLLMINLIYFSFNFGSFYSRFNLCCYIGQSFLECLFWVILFPFSFVFLRDSHIFAILFIVFFFLILFTYHDGQLSSSIFFLFFKLISFLLF